ncbi:hypothetical protein [Rubritalea tangerina]|uniref:hypothetical protein n=1 Tax=Rubritalea tangerina TaxID=430798 RepID=UPI0036094D5D
MVSGAQPRSAVGCSVLFAKADTDYFDGFSVIKLVEIILSNRILGISVEGLDCRDPVLRIEKPLM